jgi:hypothetical protein
MDIATILNMIKWAIDEEPKVADSLRNLFGKGDPTTADWDAELAATRAMDYDKIVTNTQLPPSTTAAGAPPTK